MAMTARGQLRLQQWTGRRRWSSLAKIEGDRLDTTEKKAEMTRGVGVATLPPAREGRLEQFWAVVECVGRRMAHFMQIRVHIRASAFSRFAASRLLVVACTAPLAAVVRRGQRVFCFSRARDILLSGNKAGMREGEWMSLGAPHNKPISKTICKS